MTDPRIDGVQLKEDFLYGREYAIMQKILKSLEQAPKTMPGLAKKLRLSKGSIYRSLQTLIQWCMVYGTVHYETLKATRGKLQPLYQLTGFSPMMHGGGRSETPTHVVVYDSIEGSKRRRYEIAKIKKKGKYELYPQPLPTKEDQIRNWCKTNKSG